MLLTDLQNGSDIRGIAIPTEELQQTLGVEEVSLIATGIMQWLKNKGIAAPYRIGLGCDSRLSGPELKKQLAQSLAVQGATIIDFGMATTPALFMATQFPQFNCDAGIMLTASHLPYYFNGIKLFTKTGGAEKADIAFILEHAAPVVETAEAVIETADLITPYAADLVTKILQGIGSTIEKRPLAGLKIIVDAGNGAGGFFAEKVLTVLGADTSGSQFLEPDGRFPNHIPNPDNKEAMASIRQAVLTQKADLGVIFDTDVDRSAVVTEDGSILNRNNLIAVLAAILLREHPATTIVTNSTTSDHLKSFIESKGGRQYRFISGYRNVINKALELNQQGVDCQLAIETSGHAALKENYFLDDGAYVIAKLLMWLPKLREESAGLTDLIEELQQPAETLEVRFLLQGADYKTIGNQMIERVRQELPQSGGFFENPENEEGVRITLREPFGYGWLLLRLSLHEPLLVLQIENDESGHMKKILEQLNQILAKEPAVDRSRLSAFLSRTNPA